MLIAFDPTRMPSTMKIVAGFQSLDLACFGSEVFWPSRLKALGTIERHNEGLATLGRCEVSFFRLPDVAKVLRSAECCRTHCEQMLSDCRRARDGAIVMLSMAAIFIGVGRGEAKGGWSKLSGRMSGSVYLLIRNAFPDFKMIGRRLAYSRRVQDMDVWMN